MRKFTCFLFENFDPDREAENPTNPRRVLNASADAVLSRVAEFPPLGCPADGLRRGDRKSTRLNSSHAT